MGPFAACGCPQRTEAEDICTFELVGQDSRPLPAFSAGSHLDVHLPGGITRQYSPCNDPAESHRYLIGVLKDPASRGGSEAMHTLVNEGDTLTISAPKPTAGRRHRGHPRPAWPSAWP
jgi:vanillate O-demethylase ferredoxin subunit